MVKLDIFLYIIGKKRIYFYQLENGLRVTKGCAQVTEVRFRAGPP